MKNQDWSNRKREAFGSGTGQGKVVRTLALEGKTTTLWVVLRGQLTIAGGTTNGTAKYQEHPLVALIQRIRVRRSKSSGSRYRWHHS